MYSVRGNESKGYRIRQHSGLRCALVAMMLGLGATQTHAQCTEQQKLTASDIAVDDFFGVSVSVSGNTAVVGAMGDDCLMFGPRCGAAYIYRFNGTSWVEEQKLTASDAAPEDSFGGSVSISGNTVLVGAISDTCAAGPECGAVYVFRFNGTTWVEEQKLTALDAGANDLFGARVSVNGDTAVVGAFFDDCAAGIDCGSAYVFRFNGTSWTQEQKLTASDAADGDRFGFVVSVSSDAVIVGASRDACAAGINCGSAYVFRFNGSAWTEEQKLTASDAAMGDNFGASVSISSDTAIVGALANGCAAGGTCGAAYVFRFNGTSWTQEQKLTDSDSAALDVFGRSVFVSSDAVIVGAAGDDCAGGFFCGAAHVFRFNGTSWVQKQKLTASDATSPSSLGFSVSMSGETAIVGAWVNACMAGGLEQCGAAYIFDLNDPCCGDGNLDPGEVCDSGLACTDCLCDLGFEPTLPPSVDCQPQCGNGNVDPGEECDGLDDAACPGTCRSDCTCGPFCGDGTCGPGEDSCSCTADCGIPPSSELPDSTCTDGLDNDCDGMIDSDDPDCSEPPIPTVSGWGMFIMLLLLTVGIKVMRWKANSSGFQQSSNEYSP